MSNPFNLVFDALWEMAEKSSAVSELVKIQNRLKYNTEGRRNPAKKSLSDSDFPELTLMSEGAAANALQTSSTSMIERRYAWIIQTGDQRIQHHLLPVEWALWCAMTNWCTELTALTWNGQTFVKRFNFLDIANGVIQPRDNSINVPNGWAAVWGIHVEMHFRTQDLQDFSKGNLPS